MCVICRQRFPKQNLTRYVRDPGGEFVPDPKKPLPGRGWYVCGRESCQTKFSKYRTAKRHRGEINDQRQNQVKGPRGRSENSASGAPWHSA
ncbi:MAG: YlxR family protein [Desulfovibrio sp.]